MARYEVRAASPHDYQATLPLLTDFQSTSITPSRWKLMFEPPWRQQGDPSGFLLFVDGRLEGFLGALISRRRFGNRELKFCNMTSWIVRPDARAGSLALLVEMMKLDANIITNFTPSPTVAKVLKSARFGEVQRTQSIVGCLPGRVETKIRIITRPSEIRLRMTPLHQRILDDHVSLQCEHALIEVGERYCYIVFTRTWHSRLPVLRAHYISDRELFADVSKFVTWRICIPRKTLRLLIDNSGPEAASIPFSRRVPGECHWFALRADEHASVN